ncbi:MAG: cytochrome c oxidase subunit I [Candidatus Sumerlaeaceae bacterium]
MFRALSDHKTIAKLYLLTSLALFGVGGLLAMVMRWQLAWPGSVIPLLGQMMPRLREQGGMLPPEIYAEFFTQHGTIMIFFVIIPLLVGAFGGFVIPLQVGARNIALPRVNAAAYVLHLLACIVIVGSFFVSKGASNTGWTAYAPLSSIATQGQTWWIASLLLFSLSQIFCAVCQATTILNRRAPGMTFNRLPIFTWNMLATSVITLLSTPALMAALFMLLLERFGWARFFSPITTGGEGQPLLWQHLFWFYAHPAVYIMILPAMGIVSELLPVFARKPLFGYNAFILTTWAIALLGFLVWGHHMFQSGMNPYLGTSFMAATMIIAVPSAVKTFNWIATVWRGSLHITTPFLHCAAFISLFVIGGLSGIFAASTPVDVYIHDTFFIVGHLHYVLFGGSLFAIFAGLVFWMPKMFGRLLDERLGRVHFLVTFVAYNATFFPMFILGTGGMMRRIYDPTQYAHLRPLQPLNVFVTQSAFVLGIAQLVLAANLLLCLTSASTRTWWRVVAAVAAGVATAALALPIDYALGQMVRNIIPAGGPLQLLLPMWSVPIALGLGAAGSIYVFKGRTAEQHIAAADNHWLANTLEWQISSPPPRRNYAELPEVNYPPYEYSSPRSPSGMDYLPQSNPVPSGEASA